MDRDFYPNSMDARMAWLLNFYDQLKNHGFAVKYGIDAASMTRLEVITIWIVYWVPLRHALDAYSQQVTGYFNAIAGNKDVDAPSEPVFIPNGNVPAQPLTGIEKFIRDLAAQIRKSIIYSSADGEAMGIQPTAPAPFNPTDLQPVFTAVTREAFEVGVTFKKQGMSAIRFEFRRKGATTWQSAGVLLSSPGVFTVPPATPGDAEQIELRAIFMQGNDNIGIWSAIVPVLIAP